MSKRGAPDDYYSQQPYKRRAPASVSSPVQAAPTKPPVLPDPLPQLPGIASHLTEAPFIHKSAGKFSRSSSVNDLSYERLEFLGDAYLELFASTLIFHRFSYLPAGRMSQLRELLVKNETLAEYSRAYGFDKRIEVDSMRHMEEAANKGNKGINKVLGDVFEAYVAAVVISDKQHGYTTAEEWAAALWEPRVAAWEKANARSAHGPPARDTNGDPRTTYNQDAKQELNKLLIWSGKEVRIKYEPSRPMIELKGDQIGQNQHFVGAYLTGYDVEKKLIGHGEGRSRQEAGNWAAIDAMHGEGKDFVAECAQKSVELREQKRRQEAAA